MRINIQIDRVTLDGVPVAEHQAPALRLAMEAKLRRRLAEAPESPWPPAGAAVPVLRTPMHAADPGDAAAWGEHLADAVRGVMLP